ncbi:hypothetical protein EJ04DRAFT_508085 [Polyplosphaeria fusca]|uniref:Uncharacterized protein n=1 Tax=Polyplosphaeria fusca TaxID=682080 RepID=A0A9P4RBN2_9PLEO|nr:hypothetical protein EJ04DRAFT_508085 [Polyplosphaeria fusca]
MAQTLVALRSSQTIALSVRRNAAPTAAAAPNLRTNCRFLLRHSRLAYNRPSLLQQRHASTLQVYRTAAPAMPSTLSPKQSWRTVWQRECVYAKPIVSHVAHAITGNYWFRTAKRLAKMGVLWWLKRIAINLVINSFILTWIASATQKEKVEEEREAQAQIQHEEWIEKRGRREYDIWLGKMA